MSKRLFILEASPLARAQDGDARAEVISTRKRTRRLVLVHKTLLTR